jgi:hypothetical protein
VVGADGVQRGALDDVVGVDAGVVGPIEGGEIRLIPRREQEDAVDAARLEDRVEAMHGEAGVADDEFFDFETQFGGAGVGAEDEFAVETGGGIGAVGLVEIDGGEHAAEGRAA